MNRAERNRQSAVWAAYGDALGYMTELADAERVRHRTGQSTVDGTVAWRRRVGNARTGPTVELPAGTYSDDTQLRLATARAIRADGSFDVAAFAKVEITSWANYALGAGIGSREAAANLARTSATWYSNFFSSKRSDYAQGGGNGAAMRVQPHVWAAKDLGDVKSIFRDVVRNAICTHGHIRGIAGACFHAATLIWAYQEGRTPKVSDFLSITETLAIIPEVIQADSDLRLFWLNEWMERTGRSVNVSVDEVRLEMLEDIERISSIVVESPRLAYERAVALIGADQSNARGSGTKTALLAAYLAAVHFEMGPNEALIVAANALGSDTDSIATMAGALLGANSTDHCIQPLQDRQYIERDAERLAAVAERRSDTSFGYPDLRSWKPTRAAADAVAQTENGFVLNGIGPLEPMDEVAIPESDGFALRWFRLGFGQTIFAKTRDEPIFLSEAARHVVGERRTLPNTDVVQKPSSKLPDLFASRTPSNKDVVDRDVIAKRNDFSLNSALQRVIDSGFDPEIVGQMLLAQVKPGEANFVEKSIALTATIVTAYEARMRRRR